VTPAECPACSGRWPRADHRVADLEFSVAYLNEDQFFPGWTLLVLKRHATELYHLTPAERAGLIEEVSAVAEALARGFGAVKVNYELLGNQSPHIHWHLVPRLPDDPAPQGPAWVIQHEPGRLTATALGQRLALVRRHLGR
jgi:diadenosine tetraphosphate (Ap4A) HIT family hydrolase